MKAPPRIPVTTGLLAASACVVLTAVGFGQAGMLTTIGAAAEVLVPDSAALVPSTGYTIEAWFYFNPAAPGGTSHPTILRKNTYTPSYLLRTTTPIGGSLEYYANTGGSYAIVNSSVPTPLNSWHHVAGTHDGQVARLYLDGVLIGSNPVPGPPGFVSGDLLIAKGDPYSESWRGSLDEVRLWSVAKTAAEIQASMMFERDGVPNLVAAWHFNGNYLDLTGGHDGIPNGQVTIQPSTSPVIGEEITAPALSSIGAPLVLTIKSAYPSLPYIGDVSLSGNVPGIYLPPPIDKTLPLNPPLLNQTYGSYFPSVFEDFLGFTEQDGTSTATLHVPNIPGLIGSSIYGSYVLLDAGYPLGIRHVGNGTATLLTAPPPAITSVSPNASPIAGGMPIVITGQHFSSGATVTIGTASAAGVNVIDSNTIACTTPSQPLGPKSVTVTNPDTLSGTLANGVTYVPNLAITGISPPVALPGASVTIQGNGFVSGLTLVVGGIAVPPSTITTTAVAWIVPQGVPCNASVVVATPASQTQSTPWNPAPTITSTSGASGPATGGSSFFILGMNFHLGTTVTVGGTNAIILGSSPTSLFVQAPPGTPGPAPIVVSSITGCTASSTYNYQ
jgi:Concanavalin A-like lectin/glucanases superfamily/IPT/TIG domain